MADEKTTGGNDEADGGVASVNGTCVLRSKSRRV